MPRDKKPLPLLLFENILYIASGAIFIYVLFEQFTK
jgi:hypothetical protein